MKRLTKKEKALMVKWFKESLDVVTEDEPLTARQALYGNCGRGPVKIAFIITTSAKHLEKIDGALPLASKVSHDWLAQEEVM